MNVKAFISECVREALAAEASKKDFPHLFMQMNPKDRKFIRYWNVRDDDATTTIELYCTLIGQGLLEFIVAFVDRYQGEFRIFPESGLVCIQMTIRKPKA